MNVPTHPPRIQRRIQSPATFALLALLAVGPLVATANIPSSLAKATALHVAIAFTVLLVLFRLIGKRELGRLSPFEFVTLMLVPEIVSEVVQGTGDLTASLVGLSTLFSLVLGLSILSHRFRSVQHMVEAPPALLVAHGKLIESAMNSERIAPDELIAEMHKQGLERIDDVKWGILESSGNITFVPLPRAAVSPTAQSEDPAA
jgi:uncharacterized membrane protein YcaP (DUF421 family)